MRVRDVMSKPVVTIDANRTVSAACKIMGEKHLGSLLVVKDGKPVGIFTERDLLSKILTKRLRLNRTKVGEFMSAPLTVIPPDFDVKEAARAMTQLKIRRLPVVEDGKLIGIVTSADIAKAVANSPSIIQ